MIGAENTPELLAEADTGPSTPRSNANLSPIEAGLRRNGGGEILSNPISLTRGDDASVASLTPGEAGLARDLPAHAIRRFAGAGLTVRELNSWSQVELGWQAWTKIMQFLLAAETADEVVHRAAAALGLLPQVERAELISEAACPVNELSIWLPQLAQGSESMSEHGHHHRQGSWLVVHPRNPELGETKAMLSSLLTLVATIHGQQSQRLRLTQESRTDALTGLWNRRGFEVLTRQALARAQRSNETLALLTIDLDYFKHINDMFGHASGDEALQSVARAMREVVRPGDIPARLGGDELATLLASCDEVGAMHVAQRIQEALDRAQPIPGTRITLSIGAADTSGLAANTPEADAQHYLQEAADRALYQAKNEGRACVRGSSHSKIR